MGGMRILSCQRQRRGGPLGHIYDTMQPGAMQAVKDSVVPCPDSPSSGKVICLATGFRFLITSPAAVRGPPSPNSLNSCMLSSWRGHQQRATASRTDPPSPCVATPQRRSGNRTGGDHAELVFGSRHPSWHLRSYSRTSAQPRAPPPLCLHADSVRLPRERARGSVSRHVAAGRTISRG